MREEVSQVLLLFPQSTAHTVFRSALQGRKLVSIHRQHSESSFAALFCILCELQKITEMISSPVFWFRSESSTEQRDRECDWQSKADLVSWFLFRQTNIFNFYSHHHETNVRNVNTDSEKASPKVKQYIFWTKMFLLELYYYAAALENKFKLIILVRRHSQYLSWKIF